MNSVPPWIQRLIELAVLSAILVGVNMALASDPSGDDAARGGLSALAVQILARLVARVKGDD